MKFASLILVSYTLIATAVLEARQRACTRDNCYSALWGTSSDADHPLTALTDCQKYLTTTVALYPVTTTTVICYDTSTVPGPCSTGTAPSSSFSSSGIASSTTRSSIVTTTSTLTGLPQPSSTSSLSTSSLSGTLTFSETSSLGDPFSTEIDEPTSTVIDPNDPEEPSAKIRRQFSTPAATYRTTTLVGPSPAYATASCVTTQYASACSCKGVTRGVVTLLIPTITDTITTTLSYLTTASSCGDDTATTSRSSSSTSRSSSTSLTSRSTGIASGTSSRSTVSSTSSSISQSSGDTTRSTSSTFTSSSTSQSSRDSAIGVTSTSTSTSPSGTPTCTGLGLGGVQCQGRCTDTKIDLANCGRCGNRCKDGFVCVNGVCARDVCDSNCTYDRLCGANNGTSTSNCICATEEGGFGVCFDKDRFSCSDARVRRCRSTDGAVGGCPVGYACIKDYCSCGVGSTALGICVSTVGCADSEVNDLGPLVRIGETEQRRRAVKGFRL